MKSKRLLLDNRNRRIRLPRQKLTICLEWILDRFSPQKKLEVVFVSHRLMRKLNNQWHGVDQETDVLAFPYDQEILGEIFVCTDVALRESKRRAVTLSSEIALYAVHGALHLVGYRDRTSKEQRDMQLMEVKVLGHARLVTDRLAGGLC